MDKMLLPRRAVLGVQAHDVPVVEAPGGELPRLSQPPRLRSLGQVDLHVVLEDLPGPRVPHAGGRAALAADAVELVLRVRAEPVVLTADAGHELERLEGPGLP